ncbi:hypothetical protein [Flavobacterium sp. '19STA2R22 D10 B1']|uniref:hypothetical protein n=1 Tax=Flavobacterium aerium TaxID=3037261 RepID=UPI00278BB5B1|nr:hypothetical protein [Flavobacterium sp. '19STA2R22 D10 B1']
MKKSVFILPFKVVLILSVLIFTGCKKIDPQSDSNPSNDKQQVTTTDSTAIFKMAKRYLNTSFINPSTIQYIDDSNRIVKVRRDYPYKYRNMKNDVFEKMRDTLSNKWLITIGFNAHNKNDSVKRFSYSILVREKANSLVKKEHYDVIGVKSTEYKP